MVARVAAGDWHSMAVTRTGQLLTWGRGRRLDAVEETVKVPRVVEGAGVVVGVAGGDTHSMVVRESGEVVVFGAFKTKLTFNQSAFTGGSKGN